MEKPELFSTKKEFFLFTLILVAFLALHLLFKYFSYQSFISKPFYYTHATVITAYVKHKNKRSYQVLKLRSEEGFVFYTTTHRREDFSRKRLRLQLFPDGGIHFWDYLGTLYIKSKIKHQALLSTTFKEKLQSYVTAQHESDALDSFYQAIFFATPLDKTLREKIAQLGVSHLVALSGFHLGILWGMMYGLLLVIYRPLQQRYFPYRFALIDVGIVVILLLGLYVWFVDFPPSLVRSYAMVLLGWIALLLGIKLLSFTFLTTVLGLLVVLFPSLLVSLSFWLSVAGVFYIFLLLRYTEGMDTKIITLLVIPLGIFVLMLPVVHGIFGVTTPYQLLSPLLSLLFIPFYPLVMALHLLGIGGMLDSPLQWLFALPQSEIERFLPLWAVFGYSGLSIVAIWYRRVFYGVMGLALGYGVYLFLWNVVG